MSPPPLALPPLSPSPVAQHCGGGAADTRSLSRGAENKAQMWSQRGKRSLQAELTNVLEIKLGYTRLQIAFNPEWRVSPLSPRTPAP